MKITQLISTMNTYNIKLITRLPRIIDFLLIWLNTVRFNTILLVTSYNIIRKMIHNCSESEA